MGRKVERTSMRGLKNREREERTEKCKLRNPMATLNSTLHSLAAA